VWHRPARAGNAGRVSWPRPEGRSCAFRDARSLWQGPSPLPQRHAGPCPAGGHRPGQRPARPWRALRPRRVGRWPFVVAGPAGLQGTVPRGRGKRGSRFLIPPGGAKALSPLQWQGPWPLPQRHAAPCPAGGHRPGQRPARPWRALRPRRVGRWPFVVAGPAGPQGTVAHGRWKRRAFPDPPGVAQALSPLQWQGPSPLPQRHADPWPAGGQSPRPAPDPPPAGAGLRWSRTCRSARCRPVRAGKRAAFPDPTRRGEGTFNASMAGAIAPAKSLRLDQDRPGAKAPGKRPTRPRRALRPRRVGRWPFVVPGPAGLQGTVARGRRNAGRVSCSRPEWRSCALRDARSLWQGPSPLPQRHAGPCPAGGQSPRPAPDPAGASHPPGRALACVGAGCTGLCGSAAQGRGKRGSRFLFPPKGAIPVPGSG